MISDSILRRGSVGFVRIVLVTAGLPRRGHGEGLEGVDDLVIAKHLPQTLLGGGPVIHAHDHVHDGVHGELEPVHGMDEPPGHHGALVLVQGAHDEAGHVAKDEHKEKSQDSAGDAVLPLADGVAAACLGSGATGQQYL